MSHPARAPRAGGHVYLSGFMAVGKSTVGPRLAERLDLPFVDVDHCIESAAGQPVPAIFAAEGEAGFRAREAAVLAALASQRAAVVALGGGAVIAPANRQLLRATGVVLTLTARPDTLGARLRGDAERPLAQDDWRALLAARASAYADADAQIETDDRSPDAVVAAVEQALLRLEWAP